MLVIGFVLVLSEQQIVLGMRGREQAGKISPSAQA
jgi:hypothetical protein